MIKKIAEEAGVSRTTVYVALRNSQKDITEELKSKILAIAEKYEFVYIARETKDLKELNNRPENRWKFGFEDKPKKCYEQFADYCDEVSNNQLADNNIITNSDSLLLELNGRPLRVGERQLSVIS